MVETAAPSPKETPSAAPRLLARIDRVALLLLACALAIRLGLALEIQAHRLDQTHLDWVDMRTIEENAARVAAGDVLLVDQFFGMHSYYRDVYFGPELYDRIYGPLVYYDAPLYVYAVGAVYAVAGRNPYAIPYLHAFLGTGTAWLVYAIARRLGGVARARVALGLVAFGYELVAYQGFLLRETLQAFLLAWAVLEQARALSLAPGASPKERDRAWIRAGLAWGLSWLAKTTAVLLVPALAVELAITARRQGRRAAARAALAFGLAAFLPILPFAARNVALGVGPFLMEVGSIPNVVKQNLPDHPGLSAHPVEPRARRIIERARPGSSLSALREVVREHPTWDSWPRQLGRKIAYFWAPLDVWDNVRVSSLRPLLVSLAPCFVSWALVAPLALVGAFLALRSREEALRSLPVLGVLLQGLATACLAAFLTRYCLPGWPVLCVLAAGPPALALEAARGRRPGRVGALVVATALAFVLVRVPCAWIGDRALPPSWEELRDYVNHAYPRESPDAQTARLYLAGRLQAIRRR